MSDSLPPHGLQPTRLLHPWDFPGKSTGVGCHCLLHELTLSLTKKGEEENKAQTSRPEEIRMPSLLDMIAFSFQHLEWSA